MTNLKGEFSLDLQSADSVEVRFSMVGYGVRKRIFRRPKGRMTVKIVMHPMEALQEITVTERRRQTSQTQQLDTKDLRQTPSTTGNAVEELIQQQAGVSTHNELSSQYNVRGGSSGRECRLYQPSGGVPPHAHQQWQSGRTLGHQSRHGGAHRLLDGRIRSEIW